VVETRTEIAHAIAGGCISVWAPSKIVLDAVEPPAAGPEAPGALAAWLGAALGATRLIGLGTRMPGGESIPLAEELAV
jgi:dihydroneopterin aldolase